MTVCLMLCVGLTGCNGGKDSENADEPVVTLCYINADYVQAGDESVNPLTECELSEKELQEMTGNEGVPSPAALLEMLKTVPEKLGDAQTEVKEAYVVNDVTIENGTATVDFSSENLYGGTLEEELFISQIVETLVHSYDDISLVKFRLDGEDAETLMGQVDVTEGFSEGIYALQWNLNKQ